MGNKQYRFWTNKDDQDLIDFMDSQQNVTLFLKDLVNDYRLGKLSKIDESDLKRKKLQVDIHFKEVCTLIKEKELLHWKTFDKSPSYQGLKAIKTNVESNKESMSCYDEKNHRLMCPQCGSCFVHSEDKLDIAESKENFMNHYFEKHDSNLPVELIEELRTF